jgi:hypothetical protein
MRDNDQRVPAPVHRAPVHQPGHGHAPAPGSQVCQRLGITLKQMADLVNLKEIGCMAIDMCCRCGVYVVDAKPAVACEHCVDVYHLECQVMRHWGSRSSLAL